MTKTYAQIVKQIEDLKADAEKVRRQEVDGVIGRIREAIEVYDLSAEDLGFGARNGRAAKAGKAGKAATATKGRARKVAAKAPAVVKFRNDTGGTWGGRGKRPQWLREALEQGKSLQDFAV